MRKKTVKKKNLSLTPLFIVIAILACGVGMGYGVIPLFTQDIYQIKGNTGSATTSQEAISDIEKPKIVHLPTPNAVKAIYMSQCVVGTKDFRQRLVDLVDSTELNSLIIDIKDYTGKLSFTPRDPTLHEYVSDDCGATDMESFITYLHSKNIYVIGRVTVFQDPYFSKLHPEAALKSKSTGEVWKDKKGLAFLDPGSQVARDHAIAIARASYEIGFDEINFDYIRYPSDGNVSDIELPATATGLSKPKVLEDFWKYLYDTLKPEGMVISADLFGMTTTNYDDLGIGQILERAMPYFDYIAPMVYPSHYPANFNGWTDPNKHPYDLIKYVMDAAVKRTVATSSVFDTIGSIPIASTTPQRYTKEAYDPNKMRPWLQDFDYGGNYDVAEVKAQIQATYDVGLNSWMLWAPSNRYTQGALLPE